MVTNLQQPLVAALQNPHISWVLLTGEYAYKFKKPVDLGFVDFSTLENAATFVMKKFAWTVV